MPASLLFIVTGSRGAGKTTFCADLIAAAREAGWRPAGLLSRTVFSGSHPSTIEVENLAGGEVRPLAVYDPDQPTPGSRIWQFRGDAIAWGNQVLADSIPCDFLVVDELGPLEFERGDGWQAGLAALDSGQYAIAIAVVRPELLGEALLRWSDANVIEIDTPEESAEKARILADQLF